MNFFLYVEMKSKSLLKNLIFIFQTNLIEKNPYDNFKEYYNSITLKYTFISEQEHGSVPYYLFKKPLNIDVFILIIMIKQLLEKFIILKINYFLIFIILIYIMIVMLI